MGREFALRQAKDHIGILKEAAAMLKAENAALKDEIRRHEKVFQFSAERIAALKRILKTCEWKHMDGICPLCSNDATDGHAPNCELDALLTTEEQE